MYAPPVELNYNLICLRANRGCYSFAAVCGSFASASSTGIWAVWRSWASIDSLSGMVGLSGCFFVGFTASVLRRVGFSKVVPIARSFL